MTVVIGSVGMMLKIVPFLVWQRVYAPRAGRAAVPTLGQLGWPHAEAAAYVLLTAGTLVLAAATAAGSAPAIRGAGVLLTLGALAVMPDWVREAVGALPGVREVDVELTFHPPWSPERIRARPAG